MGRSEEGGWETKTKKYNQMNGNSWLCNSAREPGKQVCVKEKDQYLILKTSHSKFLILKMAPSGYLHPKI